jgi:hypothetical protein
MISVFCLRKTTNWKSVNQPLFSGRSWVVKEIAPSLGHAALLGNPATTPFDHFLKAAEGLARPLAIEVVPCRVANAVDSFNSSAGSTSSTTASFPMVLRLA